MAQPWGLVQKWKQRFFFERVVDLFKKMKKFAELFRILESLQNKLMLVAKICENFFH